MTTAVPRGPETDAVLDLIGAAVLVGDAERPAAWEGSESGYAVLYPLTTTSDGPASDAHADVESRYQVTSVGTTRAQAQWVADRVRVAMLGGVLGVPGRSLSSPVEWAPSRGVDRDDDTNPPLFYAVDSYTVRTTPAS